MHRLKTLVRGNSSSDRMTTALKWLKTRTGLVLRFGRAIPVARRVAAVEVALVLTLAALSTEMLWLVLTPTASSSQPTALRVAPIAVGSNEARARIALLTTQGFFHREHVSSGALTSAEIAAPKTLLNLELFGVRFGDKARGGSAIIRTPDNAQDVYVVGQEIVNGVRLERVMQDRVVIRRNGVAESLFLDSDQIANAAAPETINVSSPIEVSRSHIDGDVAALFSQVEIRPRNSGPGVVISPRGSGELFRQAGIAAGDVLVAVNGTPIGGVESLATLAGTLRDSNEIILKFERDGRSETRRIVVEK